ncbi:CGL80 [Auxenochlorella protothecoides x Auxenochlorella symbiontica]
MAASGASLRFPGTQGDHFRALRRTPTGLSICCRQPSSRGVVIVTQSVPRQLHGAQAEHACVGVTLAACLRQRRSCSTGAAAAAGISSAITTTAVPALLASWRADPCRLLLSIAASLVGIAVSAALIAAIPAILALSQTARAATALLVTMRTELPETAGAMRLAGLEVADCLQEMTGLSQDLGDGLRASARAVTAAEHGVRQGVESATSALTDVVLPAVRRAAPAVQDTVQAALSERAELPSTLEALRASVAQLTVASRNARTGLSVVSAVGAVRAASETLAAVAGTARRQNGAA